MADREVAAVGHGQRADPALLLAAATSIDGVPVEFLEIEVVNIGDDGSRTLRSTFTHGDELHHVEHTFTAKEWAEAEDEQLREHEDHCRGRGCNICWCDGCDRPGRYCVCP